MFLVCVYITWHDLHLKNWEFHVSKMICLSLLGWTKFFNSLREKKIKHPSTIFFHLLLFKKIFSSFYFIVGIFSCCSPSSTNPLHRSWLVRRYGQLLLSNLEIKGHIRTHSLTRISQQKHFVCQTQTCLSLCLSLLAGEAQNTREQREKLRGRKRWKRGRDRGKHGRLKMSDLMLLSACQASQSTVSLIGRRGGQNLVFKSRNNRNYKAEHSSATETAQSLKIH